MSFTSHPSSVPLFVHDSDLEDIEGKLIERVAGHTEVLMLVADRCKTQNNHQVGRLSQNQQWRYFKKCYENIVTLRETKQEEKVTHMPITYQSPTRFSYVLVFLLLCVLTHVRLFAYV